MDRTTMHVDGHAYALAQGQDTAAIAGAAFDAARAGVGLVAVILYGNRAREIVVIAGDPVSFATERVIPDDRDDGDVDAPFEVHRSVAHDVPPASDEDVDVDGWDL